jgi:sRNA-binding carbon storage regulator CsrA/predicted transcriptional regulator
MLDTINSNNYSYINAHLEIHILGGIKFNNLERMRVTLSIQKPKSVNVLRHSIDLYNDNMVEKFVRKIAERIEIGTTVVRTTLQELTTALEQYRIEELDKENEANQVSLHILSAKEEKTAIKFLKSKDLLKQTNELIGQSGVIGEETNRLLMYLIFTSRKTNNPLHCISLGSSGVGKTHLQSKVAELIPEEDKIEITVLSANAFYYFNRTELQHKLILIEDLDGAESVLYPLRELQSKKKITKTVVHKDKKGTTKTIHLTVEGPVSVSGCTTQESIYEDNSNRSFLLYIDESSEQDKKIMHYQRRASAGKINKDDEFISARFLRDVQRILKPIKVINPYAEYLELPESVFKPRRTNSHYLQFIEALTFYKQYQRERKYDEQTGEEYIETTTQDIQEANDIINEVLLRKSDTITGAVRNHLERLKRYLKQNNQTTFSNTEIRRNLRVKETTLRRYNTQLLEEGYIKRIKKAKTKSYCFEIIDIDEYTNLKTQIDNALNTCLDRLDAASSPPNRHTPSGGVKIKKVS